MELKNFLEGKSVASLKGNEFEPDGIPLTDKVPEWFNLKFGGVVTNPELGQVLLDKDGVKTTLGHGKMNRIKAAGFAAIPEILRSGRVVNKSENWKGRGYATALVVAPVEIAGKSYVGTAVVKSAGKQRFHLEEMFLTENLQVTASKTGTGATSSVVGEPGAATGDSLTVLQDIFSVNPSTVSKVVDADGKPLVVYHSTAVDEDFSVFHPNSHFGTAEQANDRVGEQQDGRLIPVYLSITNPVRMKDYQEWGDGDFWHDRLKDGTLTQIQVDAIDAKVKDWFSKRDDTIPIETTTSWVTTELQRNGYDGIVYSNEFEGSDKADSYIAFSPTQIKSATGNNGQFDATNPDIRFSRGPVAAARDTLAAARELNLAAGYKLGDLLKFSSKTGWWDRTVGTQFNLAQRNNEFKRVYDGVQTFLSDVSTFASRAANLAPTMLPQLNTLADLQEDRLRHSPKSSVSERLPELWNFSACVLMKSSLGPAKSPKNAAWAQPNVAESRLN